MDKKFNHYNLQKFVNAKKSINEIFNDLKLFLSNLQDFSVEFTSIIDDCFIEENLSKDRSFSNDMSRWFESFDVRISKFVEQVCGIMEKSSRDSMKVAFFGRTSNGKSTVINALLGDKILPSGMGHTTSCFISMQAADTLPSQFASPVSSMSQLHNNNNNNCNVVESDDTGYLLVDGMNNKLPVTNLRQLASALNDNRLDSSSLVQLYWPVSKCPLLANDVVLIDSPGVDVSPDLDQWISRFCHDADVFVLVTNSESTLNTAEKKFFHQVNNLISKPNIFILNNRWDASASEEPDCIDLVKSQHLERGVNFLVDELKCINKKEAHKRIFFVSAKETLSKRMSLVNLTSKNNNKSVMSAGSLSFEEVAGSEDRINAFVQFEDEFTRCLSKSAISTKFEAITLRGLTIMEDVKNLINEVGKKFQDKIIELQKTATKISKLAQNKIEHKNRAIKVLEHDLTSSKKQITSELYSTFKEEVQLLTGLVKKFDMPFYDEPAFIEVYKKDLLHFVEKGLGRNVVKKSENELSFIVNQMQQSITEFVYKATQQDEFNDNASYDEMKSISEKIDMANLLNFHLDFHTLLTHFNPDIEFRFSLSPGALFRILVSYISKKATTNPPPTSPRKKTERTSEMFEINDMAMINNLNNVSVSAENHYKSLNVTKSKNTLNDVEMNPAMMQAIGLLTSTTSAILVVSVAMAWKFVGSRFILGLTALYGGTYVFERVTYTNAAKSKSYKKQFADYASKKMDYAVKIASSNCSKHIERELNSKLKQSEELVARNISQIKQKIAQHEKEVRKIEEFKLALEKFKGECFRIEKELTTFAIENNFKK